MDAREFRSPLGDPPVPPHNAFDLPGWAEEALVAWFEAQGYKAEVRQVSTEKSKVSVKMSAMHVEW